MIHGLRVVAYDVWGDKRGVVPAVTEISTVRPLNELSTAQLTVSAEALGSELLTLPVEFAVETKTDTGWVEEPGHRFLASKRSLNRVSLDAYTLSGISVAVALRWATVWEASPSSEDLKREFKSVTPGSMLGELLAEARGRADGTGLVWAPGLSWDFDAVRDSSGRPWPRNARHSWNRSDDLLKVLGWFASKGAVDWRMNGRVLQVFVSETTMGGDAIGAKIRRAFSTSLPVDESWEDIVTVARFVGDEGLLVEKTNLGAVRHLGRIERWSEQGQVTNPATANLFLDGVLSPRKGPAVEYRREWVAGASPAQPYPGQGYDLGSWVPIEKYGEDTKLRVVELQLKQDDAGNVTGAEALGTRIQSIAEKLARRTTDLSSGQVGGENGRPVAPSKVTKPSGRVEGVTVTASQALNEQGVPVGAVEVSWVPIAGNPDCEVEIRVGSDQWRLAGVFKGNSAIIAGPPTGQVSIRVRVAGTEDTAPGEWSGVASVVVESDGVITPRPTGLVLSSRLGVVYGGWDGKVLAPDGSVAGAPPSFHHLEVAVTEVDREPPAGVDVDDAVYSVPGVAVIEGEKIGSRVWLWARLVDLRGGVSAWTACGAVQVAGVKGPDIEANSVTANSINVGSVTGAIGSFVQAYVGQVTGDAANFVKAVVDNITANRAVLNTLWADIIYGRMISADMIIGGVIQADQLRLGGVNISPECLRGMGTVRNPVSYGSTSMDGSSFEVGSSSLDSQKIQTGAVKINGWGNGWIPRLDSKTIVAEKLAIGWQNGESMTMISSIVKDPQSSAGMYFNSGFRAERLDSYSDIVAAGNVYGVKFVESSTRASKYDPEPVRDLTGILDVEPVAYRPQSAIDEWRKQFGEAGPSRPLKPLPERMAGWRAEDLEAAGLGICVTHDLETGRPVGVEYSRLTVALWQVLRQQQGEIDGLKAQLAALGGGA